MTDRLPDNLALLYSRFGSNAIGEILPGDHFHVDGVEFVCQYSPGSTANRFYIVKNLELVERYRRLCRRFTGSTIVELGIAEGGSTALLALLAAPTTLVAIDLEPNPLEALTEFIEEHGFADSVRPHYGVDQADGRRLGEIVEAEIGDRSIDLVIDDCSHQFDPTRASFETLFPRLRPGGLYVIEDWNADHVMYDAVRAGFENLSAAELEVEQERFRQMLADGAHTQAVRRREPLSRLAIELLVARSSHNDIVAEVSVDEFWITVQRGPGALDPSTFRLDEHVRDHFGFLPPLRGARP